MVQFPAAVAVAGGSVVSVAAGVVEATSSAASEDDDDVEVVVVVLASKSFKRPSEVDDEVLVASRRRTSKALRRPPVLDVTTDSVALEDSVDLRDRDGVVTTLASRAVLEVGSAVVAFSLSVAFAFAFAVVVASVVVDDSSDSVFSAGVPTFLGTLEKVEAVSDDSEVDFAFVLLLVSALPVASLVVVDVVFFSLTSFFAEEELLVSDNSAVMVRECVAEASALGVVVCAATFFVSDVSVDVVLVSFSLVARGRMLRSRLGIGKDTVPWVPDAAATVVFKEGLAKFRRSATARAPKEAKKRPEYLMVASKDRDAW